LNYKHCYPRGEREKGRERAQESKRGREGSYQLHKRTILFGSRVPPTSPSFNLSMKALSVNEKLMKTASPLP
jgi:hypothetical protein